MYVNIKILITKCTIHATIYFVLYSVSRYSWFILTIGPTGEIISLLLSYNITQFGKGKLNMVDDTSQDIN
jgi:hypothetical protein